MTRQGTQEKKKNGFIILCISLLSQKDIYTSFDWNKSVYFFNLKQREKKNSTKKDQVRIFVLDSEQKTKRFSLLSKPRILGAYNMRTKTILWRSAKLFI